MSNTPVYLERGARFSQSLLWQYQRDYFANQGINAWIGNVPYYVTSNSVIAYGYAQIAMRFIQDGLRKGWIDQTSPLYLMELGTGSGRFSFQFITYFSQLMQHFGLNNLNYCYVMTDFTDSNLSYWRTHEKLKPFVEKGQLDFAIYNLDAPSNILLENKKITLSPDSIHNPIIVIGNYIFDTVTHDAFHAENGKLHEGLIEISTALDNVTQDKKVIALEQLKTQFSFRDCTTDYYQNPALNAVLKEYADILPNSTFLIPTGALACIDHLRSLSGDKLLLISGDKGYAKTSSLENLVTPHIAFHGSFSMMVNFDAIARYLKQLGGDAQCCNDTEGMKISIFSLGTSLRDMPETLWAYQEFATHFSTKEFLPIKNKIIENGKSCTLLDLIALMKLSYWDPDIFFSLVPFFIEKIGEASKPYLLELREGMQTIYDNYYFIRNHKNVLFELGHLYQVMGDLPKAIELYQETEKCFGRHLTTQMNIGICYYYQNDKTTALTYFESAAAIDPDNQNVKDWMSFIK